MQDLPLSEALGGLRHISQWFIWRLVWDAPKGKYQKTPCNSVADLWPMDAALPHNWHSFEGAIAKLEGMRYADQTCQYTLGFYLTADCGYWFLDLDKCIAEGQYSPLAQDWLGRLPGCMFEFSSSGNGVHMIGRGELPPHGMRNTALGAELYTELRGIAFGLSGRAWGNADTVAPGIHTIAAEAFPPVVGGESGDWNSPRADWVGSTDDAELVARAVRSQSAMSRFGNAASFADLWYGRMDVLERFYGAEGHSEMDAALASHLAFWTGCDGPRIERLMRQSALVRPKWDEHRRYLRDLTIDRMCAKCTDVCNDSRKAEALYVAPAVGVPDMAAAYGVAVPPLPVLGDVQTLAVSPEVMAQIDSLVGLVGSSTDWADVHNRVVPAIRAAGVPRALRPKIETAVNKRLALWDANMRVGELRALLWPPVAPDAAELGQDAEQRPEWVERYVYVRQGDCFHDTTTGIGMSRTSFNATHDRDMPVKGDGPMREDSVQWALHRWNVPLVHDTMYYPGAPAVVQYNGLEWANLCAESSFPRVAEGYSEDGRAGIEAFQRHMWELCGRREKVYLNLLSFMAHNVQKPGVKIRWAPIIKGVPGDGKTMIGNVMSAAMGGRNVASIGPDIVCNSGGFSDWAHGNAFILLEELYMAGKDRHRISNGIKQFITNDFATINVKGGKPKKILNTCNQAAVTNHNDAVPLEDEDRRWFVIFTPFANLLQLIEKLELADENALGDHFGKITRSMREQPGEWRKWLLDFQIPDWFKPNQAALITEEKKSMQASGRDDLESMAREIVELGAYGVSNAILSSACLTLEIKKRSFSEGVEIPKGHSVHHLLNRIGFMQIEKLLKWNGQPHRIWVRAGTVVTPENLRRLLDLTKATVNFENGNR